VAGGDGPRPVGGEGGVGPSPSAGSRAEHSSSGSGCCSGYQAQTGSTAQVLAIPLGEGDGGETGDTLASCDHVQSTLAST